MRDTTEKIGKNAGKVWEVLNKHGPLTGPSIIKSTKLSEDNFYSAVGWLARENKINKSGNKYTLGETNLTGKIGENAGKIWNLLISQRDVDVSSIAEITQITVKDAYSALGWLAREDKIKTKKFGTKTNQTKISLK